MGIIQKENALKLSHREAMLLVKALDEPLTLIYISLKNCYNKFDIKTTKKRG